jgi:hypothetical protein
MNRSESVATVSFAVILLLLLLLVVIKVLARFARGVLLYQEKLFGESARVCFTLFFQIFCEHFLKPCSHSQEVAAPFVVWDGGNNRM